MLRCGIVISFWEPVKIAIWRVEEESLASLNHIYTLTSRNCTQIKPKDWLVTLISEGVLSLILLPASSGEIHRMPEKLFSEDQSPLFSSKQPQPPPSLYKIIHFQVPSLLFFPFRKANLIHQPATRFIKTHPPSKMGLVFDVSCDIVLHSTLILLNIAFCTTIVALRSYRRCRKSCSRQGTNMENVRMGEGGRKTVIEVTERQR